MCYVVGCGRSGSTILAEILSHRRPSFFFGQPCGVGRKILKDVDVEKRCWGNMLKEVFLSGTQLEVTTGHSSDSRGL